MHEVEIKVLEIDRNSVEKGLEELGAKKISGESLTVDWYGPKGLTHKGDDPWFLRVRTYSGEGKHEVTWKGISDIVGNSRKTKEINFTVSDPKQINALFEELNLEKYAHQEKDRESWRMGDMQFDLDTYPGMPSFLEIEAPDENHIKNIMEKLNLSKHETWNDGERTLISEKYKLDWNFMHF